MNKKSTIFILDDDYAYGKLLQTKLLMEQFENVQLYTNEEECLKNMVKKPVLLVIDYHLHHMTGLQFIQKAKSIHSRFASFLISGEFNFNFQRVKDDRFLRYVDRYFIKGMDEFNEITESANSLLD